MFTAFTKQEFDWLLSFLVPGSVYLGLSALVPILTEALAVSITDITGTFAKISAILTTLFYTIVAVFIFGISIVSIAPIKNYERVNGFQWNVIRVRFC